MLRLLPKLIILAILFILITPSSSLAAERQQGFPFTAYLPMLRKDEQPAWIGPEGGYIPAIAISPQNPQVMYAGSWGAGVFKSTDGGASWGSCSIGLGNLLINSLAVNPLNPDEVYAGTYRGKLYKSVNGCSSWTFASSGIQDQAIVYSIVVDPKAPWNVYIATRGISNNGDKPWNGVVYYSRDSGASWYPSLEDLGGENYQDWIYALGIDPIDPSNIFGASHEHGFYMSESSGSPWTWTERKDGLDDWAGRAVLVNPSSPNILYYGSWHGGQVAKSTNTGIFWFPSSSGMAGVKVYGMGIAASNPNILFLAAATDGIYKSPDGGASWSPAGLGSLRHYTVQVNPQNSSIAFAGTIGDGIYKTTNGGSSWARSDRGLRNTSISGWAVSPNDPNIYYTGTDGGSMWKSLDRGASWNKYNSGLGDEYVRRLVQRPDNLYILFALTNSGGLYFNNTSTGSTWTLANVGLPAPSLLKAEPSPFAPWDAVDYPLSELSTGMSPDAIQAVVPLIEMAFGISNPQAMYLGTEGFGMYRSPNGSASWDFAGRAGETIWAIAVDPLNHTHVYAANNTYGGMDVSTNSGASWVDGGLPDRLVYSLSYSPINPQVLYAGTDVGVYRLQAGIWSRIGLAYLPVTAVTADPNNSLRICAGTYSGAFCSADGGTTWYQVPTSFAGAQIRSIYFDPVTQHHVYFNTLERGTLRYRLTP